APDANAFRPQKSPPHPAQKTPIASTGAILGLALCAVPVSIAISESLLGIAILFRLIELIRRRAKLNLPRVFWYWLAWAALESIIWTRSPEPQAGRGEIRHLLLIGSLFLVLPALTRVGDQILVWRGLFATATLNSLVLIGLFAWRFFTYH